MLAFVARRLDLLSITVLMPHPLSCPIHLECSTIDVLLSSVVKRMETTRMVYLLCHNSDRILSSFHHHHHLLLLLLKRNVAIYRVPIVGSSANFYVQPVKSIHSHPNAAHTTSKMRSESCSSLISRLNQLKSACF